MHICTASRYTIDNNTYFCNPEMVYWRVRLTFDKLTKATLGELIIKPREL